MKLATLKNDSRDGLLVVVNKALTKCVAVPEVAQTMQEALDNWNHVEPQLNEVYVALNNGELTSEMPFDPALSESPLPRAYQWADGSAYVNHVELVRKARGAEMPPSFWTDPLMYQGGSDAFIGPYDDIPVVSEEWGIDFEGEVAVVTGDVAMGVTTEEAAKSIRLIMLVNDVSLRGLIPNELAKGFGFFQSKPSSVFSPVAVTPDELGEDWDGGKVNLPLLSFYNNEPFGCPNAGVDMTFEFPELIAHAAKSRPLSAGAIIGSGTVSNKQGTDFGTAIAEGGVGYSCIAEVRMIETIRDGSPSTSFMKFGDRIKMEMKDADGHSIFGAIDQQVVKYE
ncbi:fumarylacetoacetate hydrolase family protein [Vibrio europaeus]|uniref:2-keto-4-pentenoate hydratase n=1 Tax=Vibrio europaeus TaxID=300876 RepID=A0A178JFG2_9VIBR|nr:fumarylacetoacetate hydrolase family protein [Vibrio europaeus]MDC5707672.1 fumarylacetoacetate hydrolase family protein [Vibrio europaeus]MDC5709918.1 fumarylacetoacetate hydrolase family protein [Vibrio europaeus]MDC5716605.1 fumarylacetoacetate hydrolase family protein [Vibrio europaeus]MDC5722776.1 fumarylacetoacetate hydrolase family protein [Vibrio europaeus]MDC5726890.1 fumarylacetoacetate hydrolase family protein [Vibrio europaeus]